MLRGRVLTVLAAALLTSACSESADERPRVAPGGPSRTDRRRAQQGADPGAGRGRRGRGRHGGRTRPRRPVHRPGTPDGGHPARLGRRSPRPSARLPRGHDRRPGTGLPRLRPRPGQRRRQRVSLPGADTGDGRRRPRRGWRGAGEPGPYVLVGPVVGMVLEGEGACDPENRRVDADESLERSTTAPCPLGVRQARAPTARPTRPPGLEEGALEPAADAGTRRHQAAARAGRSPDVSSGRWGACPTC